jgi:hypothetical protein
MRLHFSSRIRILYLFLEYYWHRNSAMFDRTSELGLQKAKKYYRCEYLILRAWRDYLVTDNVVYK